MTMWSPQAATYPEAQMTGWYPWKLAVAGPSVSVEKRGIGSVGDFGERGNWWNGEKLRVLMMERSANGDGDGWNYSQWFYQDAEEDEKVTIVNSANDEVQTPKQTKVETDNKLTWTVNDKPRYYPNEGTHDFFAYHLDDANYIYDHTNGYTADSDNSKFIVKDTVITPNSHATQKYVWFKIDGSQDLMTGMAVKKTDADELAASSTGFSAATARAGVIPNIVMKHRLTRFTFQVVGMNDDCSDVSVEKITVKSKTTGKMIVAYDMGGEAVAPTQTLFFEVPTGSVDAQEAALVLKDYNEEESTTKDLVPVTLVKGDGNWGETYQNRGHCLMVAPGEKEYEMVITLKQTFKTDDGSTNPAGTTDIKRPIVIPESAAAAEGTSYNVKVKVYGMAKIEVEATLEAWKEGGDIDVDTNLDGGATEEPEEDVEEPVEP